MIDCNGNDVTQEAKIFFDSLEDELVKSKRQFENCYKCKQEFHKKMDKIMAEMIDYSNAFVLSGRNDLASAVSYCIEIIDKYRQE